MNLFTQTTQNPSSQTSQTPGEAPQKLSEASQIPGESTQASPNQSLAMSVMDIPDSAIASPPLPFTDVETLRSQARKNIEQGAVTATYSADRVAVLKLLNEALATELVCVLRYRCHHFMARGIHAKGIADEFLAHSNEELGHADLLAARIVQLGGEPDFAPDQLTSRSHAEYVVGESLTEMIKEDLIAERIAIDSYREMIQYLGDKDPTTSQILKTILSVEEEHADELADLLNFAK